MDNNKQVNTAENLRLWMRSCPAIDTGSRFNVDYMGHYATEYAIYSSPSSISYRQDICGNIYLAPQQELNFLFISKFPLSMDILGNLENLGFFQEITKWMHEQNILKNFPEIEEGRVLSILPSLSPYLYDAGTDSGRYQIQIKIKYRPY